MNPTSGIKALLLAVFLPWTGIAQQMEIIGYYPSWKWNRPHWLLTPERIPYEKLTMINYAFFVPSADGARIMGKDSVGDGLLLPRLVELAHRHGIKVLVSIGGWEDSGNFPALASTEPTRQAFARSCTEVITAHGFDGIDIDWEFPCLAEHRGTTDDRANFTKLLRTTREALDAFGVRTGKRYLLTAALPASEQLAQNFEMDSVARILDMLNIMTYDMNGPWDSLSGYNAPLYAPRPEDSLRTIDAVLKLYTIGFHVPSLKINLGLPFYGHAYRECSGPALPHKGEDRVHFPLEGCFYYNIVPLLNTLTRTWDDRARVPYLTSADWRTFVSYDDEESIREKTTYAADKSLRGVVIWEITGDYLEDGRSPLLDVVYSTLRGSPKK